MTTADDVVAVDLVEKPKAETLSWTREPGQLKLCSFNEAILNGSLRPHPGPSPDLPNRSPAARVSTQISIAIFVEALDDSIRRDLQ